MGAIAEAIANYAQPLLDQTDGSVEQLNKVFSIAQFCWNLALLPEEGRDEALAEMQPALKMDDDEFDEFRRCVIVPMIRRHQDMFPRLHRRGSMERSTGAPLSQTHPTTLARTKKYPGTGRNEPCPCNSGKKYKFCCGR
jgi:hypothetical protein